MFTNEKFNMKAPHSVWTIIARFLMSIMMHFSVEPDIRNGIAIMKYTVNHPSKFKSKDGSTSYTRVFLAFFLGLCQASVAIVIELLAIRFLSCFLNLLNIITKFVSMTRIAMFDNFLSAALVEETMKKAAGTTLPTEYKRFLGRMNETEIREFGQRLAKLEKEGKPDQETDQ